jgi:hypothetical protein
LSKTAQYFDKQFNKKQVLDFQCLSKFYPTHEILAKLPVTTTDPLYHEILDFSGPKWHSLPSLPFCGPKKLLAVDRDTNRKRTLLLTGTEVGYTLHVYTA